MCNAHEGFRLTGEEDSLVIGNTLRNRGGRTVLVKLGSKGCHVINDDEDFVVDADKVHVVDTTGAGDAFAAGFIAAMMSGESLRQAVVHGNRAGARIVQQLGAITAWMDER
jgi:sugar/nucleoside kinase (ribokinase family)